ncbi:MAG TPA: relaxase, partial [Hyphomonas sp.]|nr:relaxase [Hyphomonas sp.]
LEKQNQLEVMWALRRDQDQRQMTINAQLRERGELQKEINAMRTKHAQALRALHHDTTNYRLMRRGEEPKAKTAFERLDTLRAEPKKRPERPRFDKLKERKPERQTRSTTSAQDRLRKLREQKREGPSYDGPDLDR